jgi:ketosteroid isomerase-like protein
MRVLLAVLCLGLPAAAAAQTGADAEVRETLVAMWAAVEAGDLETYASYLHPDYTAFGESDPYLTEGKPLELRSMEDYLRRARGVHTEMHQPTVTVRGDVAWITYYWSDRGEVDGRRTASRGKSTRIFVRENDRWLCIHGHFTKVP